MRSDHDLPWTIWSERPIPDGLRHLLEPDARSTGPWELPGEDPLRGIEGADGTIASARMRYDGAVFERAARLRVVARTGVGVDNVAVDEATRRGVAVCNVPGGPTISTAEHAITLMLAAAKRLKSAVAALAAGSWDTFNEHQAVELAGMTLGVVGLGKIGRRVARVALALDMRVLAWDPHLDDEDIREAGVQPASSLDELLAASQVVSLHAPLTEETRGLLDRRRIGLLPHGAVLVNTSRGGLINEEALLEALDSGRLGAVGLDVFEHEPLASGSPLVGRADVVATPHLAAGTVQGRERLWRAAIEDVMSCLRGEVPRGIVNPGVLETEVTEEEL